MSTSELLEQWREASRAAALAEKLAELARESMERADRDSLAATEIAEMAEEAAQHAERASRVARQAASRASLFASENRAGRLADADEAVTATHTQETSARDRYHQAERAARDRIDNRDAQP